MVEASEYPTSIQMSRIMWHKNNFNISIPIFIPQFAMSCSILNWHLNTGQFDNKIESCLIFNQFSLDYANKNKLNRKIVFIKSAIIQQVRCISLLFAVQKNHKWKSFLRNVALSISIKYDVILQSKYTRPSILCLP